MKSRFIVYVAAFFIMAFSANAQTKIGYADVDYIYTKMPESKKVESQLQSHTTMLQNQMQAKYTDYDAKLKAFQAMPADTPEAIQQDKANELQQLQESITKFQQDAQSSLEKKRGQLMEPVYTLVGNAIKAVAEENSYNFILTAGVGGADIVLYASEKDDVSELVLKKLGAPGN